MFLVVPRWGRGGLAQARQLTVADDMGHGGRRHAELAAVSKHTRDGDRRQEHCGHRGGERDYRLLAVDGTLHADPDRLTQLLRNLVRNAVIHTSAGYRPIA
jgi:signal transduction histidine kinase